MRNRWRTATIALAAVVLTVGVQQAFGALRGASTTSKTGKAVSQVKVVRNDNASSVDGSSKGYVNIPGAVADITVPNGEHALILGLFSAETTCYGGGKGGWCGARMTVDGVEMQPGDDFALDSSDNNTETSGSWEGHAFQGSSNILGPGTYTVRVQYYSVAGTTMGVDDYHLTVMRIKA